MNAQFKKGILDLCVLALLDKRDRYGYELIQSISRHVEISEGAVYPVLRRLMKDGLLTSYLQESSEGPSRKYYSLTSQGRNYLQELMNEWREFSQGVDQLLREGVADD